MYGSIVISLLTKKTVFQSVDSLHDLQQEKSVKILIRKHSFVDDVSKTIPALAEMKDRFELFHLRWNYLNKKTFLICRLNVCHVIYSNYSNLFTWYFKCLFLDLSFS